MFIIDDTDLRHICNCTKILSSVYDGGGRGQLDAKARTLLIYSIPVHIQHISQCNTLICILYSTTVLYEIEVYKPQFTSYDRCLYGGAELVS